MLLACTIKVSQGLLLDAGSPLAARVSLKGPERWTRTLHCTRTQPQA